MSVVVRVSVEMGRGTLSVELNYPDTAVEHERITGMIGLGEATDAIRAVLGESQ